jgi:D-serine deaminase-like pyridoxal phosphate-dependent protein
MIEVPSAEDLDALLAVDPPRTRLWENDPGLYWATLDGATWGRDNPVAALSLPALRHNIADIARRAGGVPIRVASKSLRVRPIIDALVRLDQVVGVLAYDLAEAIWLATDTDDRAGIEDVLLGYPTANRGAIGDLCANPQALQRVTLLVDSIDELDLIDSVCPPGSRDEIRIAIDLDASLRLPGVGDLGVLRSPIHTQGEAVSLASAIVARAGFRLVGVMSYEAQVAGVGNDVPGKTLENHAIRAMQGYSMRELRHRRSRIIDEIGQLTDLEMVNAGGTGSIEATAKDRAVTDIAVGSGYFGGHLFDNYQHFQPAPALGFGLAVVRKPRRDVVTCHGGGWIASGPPGEDRLPRVVWPAGLHYQDREAAGEVQTPLRGEAAIGMRVGDRVWLRHTKSGELSERINSMVLVDDDAAVGEVPTYRGEGKAFV